MDISEAPGAPLGGIEAKQEESCPRATVDIAVNLKNRQKAIDTAGYGPMNPKHANNEFWREKGERWDVSRTEARKQTCGNCAAFVKTTKMLNCINDGLSAGSKTDSWDTIEAGELGYCEAFDFKCASSRTCDAWIVGGPITDESRGMKEKTLDQITVNEKTVSQYIDSLDDDEFDILFPSTEEPTEDEAKWLFDVGGAFLRRSLTNRRKRRKRRSWKDDDAGIDTKSSKKPVLRDPDGGLTAAGRKYFKEKEGANLKPGVRGPADTPMKMRRKGSFLVRFFKNPRGPLVDKNGKPTRLALSARAWGEPAPTTAEAARKLAAKGEALLDRYRRYQENQKKKSLGDSIEVKRLGSTIGQRNGTADTQERRANSSVGSSNSGSSGSGGNYNPGARDADGDGTVQEGTDYARPTEDKKKKNQRTGTADSRERRAEADERKRTGKGQGFDKIRTPQEMEAYRRSQGLPPKPTKGRTGSADRTERDEFGKQLAAMGFDDATAKKFGEWIKSEANKLKPGQKTNWLPGRLPNGGRISEDGTYIPPDMVRRDDKTQSDYYRNRRNQKPDTPVYDGPRRPAPGAQPDRADGGKPRSGDSTPRKPFDTTPRSPGDGGPRTPWSTTPQAPGDGGPRTPWSTRPQAPGDGGPRKPWDTTPRSPGQKPKTNKGPSNKNTPPAKKPTTRPYSGGAQKPWSASPSKPKQGKPMSGSPKKPGGSKPSKPWNSGPKKPFGNS